MDYNIIYQFMSDIHKLRPHVIRPIFGNMTYDIAIEQLPNPSVIQYIITSIYGITLDPEKEEILYTRDIYIKNQKYILAVPVLDPETAKKMKFEWMYRKAFCDSDSNLIIFPTVKRDGHGCNVYDIYNLVKFLVDIENAGLPNAINVNVLMPFIIANACVYNGKEFYLIPSLLETVHKFYNPESQFKSSYFALSCGDKIHEIDDLIRGAIEKIYPNSSMLKPEVVFDTFINKGKLIETINRWIGI